MRPVESKMVPHGRCSFLFATFGGRLAALRGVRLELLLFLLPLDVFGRSAARGAIDRDQEGLFLLGLRLLDLHELIVASLAERGVREFALLGLSQELALVTGPLDQVRLLLTQFLLLVVHALLLAQLDLALILVDLRLQCGYFLANLFLLLFGLLFFSFLDGSLLSDLFFLSLLAFILGTALLLFLFLFEALALLFFLLSLLFFLFFFALTLFLFGFLAFAFFFLSLQLLLGLLHGLAAFLDVFGFLGIAGRLRLLLHLFRLDLVEARNVLEVDWWWLLELFQFFLKAGLLLLKLRDLLVEEILALRQLSVHILVAFLVDGVHQGRDLTISVE